MYTTSVLDALCFWHLYCARSQCTVPCRTNASSVKCGQVLANSFPDIDRDIDAREYSFPDGEKSDKFKGSHRLERLIFR